jgi:hypothetical protein
MWNASFDQNRLHLTLGIVGELSNRPLWVLSHCGGRDVVHVKQSDLEHIFDSTGKNDRVLRRKTIHDIGERDGSNQRTWHNPPGAVSEATGQ